MKDTAISFVRIMSMLFIIICHLGSFYDSAAVAQLFNVGVPVFLFISGFLYGKKDICSWMDWGKKRWISLMLPCYLWIMLLVMVGALMNVEMVNTQSCWLVLFNLQGLSFLADAFNWAQVSEGIGALWFLTALMLCYACLPLLQKIQPWIQSRSQWGIVYLLLIAFVLKCICDYTLGIHLGYLLTFCIGYFWSRIWSLPSSHAVVIWSCVAAASCALRVGGKVLWDDSFLYNQVIVSISQTLLAICVFQILYWLHSRLRKIVPYIEAQGGVSQYIDKLTFYIYITHYIFLTGTFNVRQYIPENAAMQLVLFSLLTLGSAILLERLSTYPIKLLLKQKS